MANLTINAPDLAQPILAALLDNIDITARLPTYKDSVPIFTRRPPPTDAPYPMIIVSPDITKQNLDGVDDFRPVITRDIAIYGFNDSSPNYRTVELLANIIYGQFHRQRLAIDPPDGWVVVSIESMGPVPAPADDDMHVARIIALHVQLAQQNLLT